MNGLQLFKAKQDNLDSKMLQINEEIMTEKAQVEREMWQHIVTQHAKEVRSWIKKNLFEALMILSAVDSNSADPKQSPWVFTEGPDGQVYNIHGRSECKYFQSIISFGLGKISKGVLRKAGITYGDFNPFAYYIPVKTSKDDPEVFKNFIDLHQRTIHNDICAEMKEGTEPLIDFIREVVDPIALQPAS